MPLTVEQEKVVKHGKGNILVSASAGSGKTHTITQRVIRLITTEKVNVSEILCVTFTEKAAFEMKERLKKALTDIIENNDDKRLKEQLSEIATSDISTLHAFCAKLIRSYFFVVGVAPDFKILEESEATVLKVKSIEKTFKEFYDSGESWFYTLIYRHAVSRSDKKFKEIVLDAYSFCNSEAEPSTLMEKSLYQYTENGFKALIGEFKRVFDDEINRLKNQAEQVLSVFEVADFEKGIDFAKALLADMEYALLKSDVYQIKRYEDYKLPASFGRITDQTVKDCKNQITAVRDGFAKLCKKFLKCVGNSYSEDCLKNHTTREHTEWFLRVLNRFSDIYAQDKQDENALDFNDLEHFALKILQDKQVLETVKNKYKYIFVDEYQDTNGVQESIIDKIQDDNVFMVGDVKQSIYGFRGCRSEFFTLKDKLMTAKGQAVVRLNENFRSAKNVIDMVNRIFSYCMTEDVYGENYRGRSELIYGGTFSESALGRAQLHFLERAEKEEKKEELPRIYDILDEKPSVIENHTAYTSALVCDIINKELEKEIYDAKSKKFRRVNYGDICLLTRSRDSSYVRDLISGLVGRNVPIESDTEVNVLDYAEIKMLVNVLKLIDCFSQDVPLVSTLKSPIANVTDEELMDISLAFRNDKKRGNFFQAYRHYIENYDDALKEKLLKFDNYFKEIRFVSDFLGAHGILEKVINEKDFKGYLLATTGGKDKLIRV
ncbi:MAG: UvrD-helicase domain-containing protein, partial [Clostridia bacterium]|nr:UvrD-helicase domain-containing protein [Clostridia bacterium]